MPCVRRVWELWFRFKLTAQKSTYLSACMDPEKPLKPYALWYLRHKYYGSSKFIFHFCFVKSLLENLVLISPLFYGTTATDTYGGPGEAVCPQTQWTTWPYLAIVFYDFVLFSFAAVKFGAFIVPCVVRDHSQLLSGRIFIKVSDGH